MPETARILLSTDEHGVTTLLMNRPEKLNSWDYEMEAQLMQAARAIERDLGSHRVLVIRGAGKAFCAGVDMALIGAEQTMRPRDLRTHMAIRHRFFDWVENIELPVVAAVHGYCLGGGLELALACDFRLLSDDARLAMPELGFAQIPGSGAASRLASLANASVAKDLIMTCRRIDAAEADRFGLATRVFAAERFGEGVDEFCRELASRPPLAVAMTKQIVGMVQSVDAGSARALERLGQSALLGTEDLAEGLAAAGERRAARFTGR